MYTTLSSLSLKNLRISSSLFNLYVEFAPTPLSGLAIIGYPTLLARSKDENDLFNIMNLVTEKI